MNPDTHIEAFAEEMMVSGFFLASAPPRLCVNKNITQSGQHTFFRIRINKKGLRNNFPLSITIGEILKPKRDGTNFGEWLSGLLGRYPAAYMQIDKYLRKVMPDIQGFQNELIGKDFKNMKVQFQANQAKLSVDFKDLSDGEKCFFLCAVVLAANQCYGPLFCFWDEPDSFMNQWFMFNLPK